ncbi:MAG TPA: hypothetical protein VES03_09300 [Motilibacterales bacterium]|nr:hypothetical protein [Motilibacterales bacterium]
MDSEPIDAEVAGAGAAAQRGAAAGTDPRWAATPPSSSPGRPSRSSARVFLGLLGIVMAVAMPIGMAVFGPLADVVSVEIVLIAGGALTVAAGLVIRVAAPALGSSDDLAAAGPAEGAEGAERPS